MNDDMRMQEDGGVRDGQQRRHGRDNGGNSNAIPDDEPALDGYAR